MSFGVLIGVVCVGIGLQTDAGRGLVVRAADGLSLGPVGRLHLEGLTGDVLGNFRLREIEIIDDRGPWVRGRDIHVKWRPLSLIARRVRILDLSAGEVALLRQPHVAPRPPNPPSRIPIGLTIDQARIRLTSTAAFSVAEGAWRVEGGMRLRRSGALRADVRAMSLRHAGDGGQLELRFGDHDAFKLRADIVEAQGGAAAGALGLPAGQALQLSALGAGVGQGGSLAGSLTSGGRSILALNVSWLKGAGTARAHVALDASRYTHYLAARLGPTANVDIKARPAGKGVTAADVAILTPQGRLDFKGDVDGRWRTRDARLALEVPDLSKWFSTPKIGATRLDGVITGGFTDFAVKGRVVGHDIVTAGYRLGSAAGPMSVSLHAGEWRFGGDLLGAGGGGDPLAAGLLGAAPKVVSDTSILKDGRLLVRNLKVDGSALRVTASGGEALFGGLAFTGGVDVLDLGRARPGLRGAVAAHVDAKKAKGAEQWSFTLKAEARGLVTGVVDIDHFLGDAPKGSVSGALSGSKGVQIATAELSGRAVSANGKGALDPGGAISGAFQWRASGPFVAGPLEIAGAASGEGALSGMVKAPRLDLKAELANVDLGALKLAPAAIALTVVGGDGGTSGAVSIAGSTGAYGPATAKASFQTSKDEIVLSDAVVDAGGVKGSGEATIRGGRVVRGNATFFAGAGAFLEAGRLEGRLRLEDGPGGAAFKGNIDGVDIGLRSPEMGLASLHLRGEGPLKALPVDIIAEGARADPFSFAGKGLVRAEAADLLVSLQGGGRVRKATFNLNGPAELRLSTARSSLRLGASVAGGALHVDVVRTGEDLVGGVKAEAVDIAPFVGDFVGKVSGQMDLSGRGPRLSAKLTSQVQGLRSRDEPEREGLSGTVTAVLEDQRLRINGDAFNVAGLKSHGEVELPTEAAAAPFRVAIVRTKPLSGNFSVDGEVRPLWDVLAGGERTLAGRISATGSVAGTLNRPLVTGTASLADGKFGDIASGFQLQGLGVDAVFGQDALTVQKFSGADGHGGSISGDGRVSFEEAGDSTFRLVLKKFQLLDNNIGRATASGSVLVAHPAKGQGRVSGTLVVDRADIVAAAPTPNGVVPMEVVEIHQNARRGQAPAAVAVGPPIALDVAVRAARGVYLKGRGLNLELSLDSRVTGSIDHPAFDGVARVVAGNYDFAGKRFDVENSGTIHLGASAAQIRLDLSATWTDPTITAVVRVQGTAAKPEITLTSSPVLPQDEILARVLFGVSASQLAPAQGAEMASALASLAGGGGFDVIGNLRQFAGLDRLALGATQTAGTTISGGKYISKDIYLELTGGARNGTGAQVEWRIRKNLSLISRYGAALDPRYPNDTDASLSIRFRKDF